MRRLFISFSGGETSAYMAVLLTTIWRFKYNEVVTAFANTGEENEETLFFVNRCDKEYGFKTVWLESVVNKQGEACTHRVTNYEYASRRGEPFEAVIQKYGIPNASYLHCTRELKLNPIRSYLRSVGWIDGTFDKAIGIRADERKRADKKQSEKNIIYPFIDWKIITKPDVNKFWSEQKFRLDLTGYQGNCKTCHKKSLRKLLTIMDESPEKFDFFERMEDQYGTVNASPARAFFRQHMTVKGMRDLYQKTKGQLHLSDDDSRTLPLLNLFDLDSDEGCSESCEVNF